MKKKERKNFKSKIFLIISLIVLVLSAILFGYLTLKNTEITKDLDELKLSMTKTKEKIINDEKELEQKENEHEKLQEELKEKLEELEIWKETKKKLELSLQ